MMFETVEERDSVPQDAFGCLHAVLRKFDIAYDQTSARQLEFMRYLGGPSASALLWSYLFA
jgi:hypothetical protein